MYTYIFIFIYALLLAVFFDRFNLKLKWIAIVFCVVFLTVFFGSKYNTGTDSGNYQRLYDYAIYIYDLYGEYYLRFPEVLYFGLNLFSSLNGFSTVLIYTVCGFLIAFTTLYSAINVKVNPILLLVIIFPFHIVMMAISGIRQGVAESFVLLAASLIITGNRKSAFWMIVIATGFHASALIFMSLIVIEVKKRYLFIFVPFLVVCSLIGGSSEYGHYIGSNLFNAGVFMRVGFVLVLSLAIYLLIKNVTIRSLARPYSRWVYFSYYSFPGLVMLALVNTTLSDRVSYYFICIISLVYLVLQKRYGSPKFVTPIIILASFVCLFAFLTIGNHAQDYHYDSYIYHLFDNHS
ncbi:EpsG family protein [Vibrio splendidus]|uniref:EpsG family protein n=1 Tax=Vibrio splendidus TaxID=29497 RepID=UPI000CC80EF5|nr:EpsG family protein [Vibrio splendidus]PMK12103.1 hypothetical protein BCU08_05135 [Vibrio splendidus]